MPVEYAPASPQWGLERDLPPMEEQARPGHLSYRPEDGSKIRLIGGFDDRILFAVYGSTERVPMVLLMLPDASHGAQSQHAELFLANARLFLNS